MDSRYKDWNEAPSVYQYPLVKYVPPDAVCLFEPYVCIKPNTIIFVLVK